MNSIRKRPVKNYRTHCCSKQYTVSFQQNEAIGFAVDPDPDSIGSVDPDPDSEGQKNHKHRKKLINFIFLSAGCSLLTAEGFSCGLGVLYGSLGICKL